MAKSKHENAMRKPPAPERAVAEPQAGGFHTSAPRFSAAAEAERQERIIFLLERIANAIERTAASGL